MIWIKINKKTKQEDENGQKDNNENKDKQKTRINKNVETMKMTMNDTNDSYLLNANITVVLQINSNIP